MDIAFAARDEAYDTALVLLAAEGSPIDACLASLPEQARGLMHRAVSGRRFTGKADQAVDAFVDAGAGPRRVLIVGLGNADYERAGGTIAARLLTSVETGATVIADAAGADDAARLALGIQLRSWRQDRFRTELKAEERPSLERVTIIASGGVDASWQRQSAIANGILFARMLVTEPGNILYREIL